MSFVVIFFVNSDRVSVIASGITKTRACNIQRFFTDVKMTIFSSDLFLLFLLKTYIVGTR